MLKLPRTAVDLTLLHELADNNESSLAAYKAAQKRVGGEFVVTPTTLTGLGLAWQASQVRDANEYASIVNKKMFTHWNITDSVELTDAQCADCSVLAQKIIAAQLLGNHAQQVALTIAEAAYAKCNVLLTYDPDLLEDFNQGLLRRLLAQSNLGPLLISTPAKAG